jgi:hypothetical protein
MADEASQQLLYGVRIQTRDGKIWQCQPLSVRSVMRFEAWTKQHAAAMKKNAEGHMADPDTAARVLIEMAEAFPAAVGQPDLIDVLNPADIPDLLIPFYFCQSGASVVPTNGTSGGTTSSPTSSPPPAALPAST